MARGFASYTKTGRSIALGRSFGEAMARGSNRNSSNDSSNSEEPPCFFTFMLLLICAALLQSITQALKQKQLQPQ
jgi:hypothetical protein